MILAAQNDSGPDKVMRVLHVFLFFQPDFTGEGLYFEKLAPLLNRLGIRSDVAVAAGKPAAKIDIPGVDAVYRFVDAATETRPWGNRSLLLWFLLNAWRYDVVHFHCFVDRMFLLHVIARCFRCRVVQSATLDDGLGMAVDGYRQRSRRLVRWLCRLIHHVVTISPQLFEDTLRVLPQRRVSLIPQGVQWQDLRSDPSQRATARAAFGFAPDDIVLLFVGGICARKDVRFLLDAMPIIRRNNGSVRLLVVGPDLEPVYAESVRRQAALLGDGVTLFTGLMADPATAYFAADIFVFASRQEGFGNVLIEAMAAGLPVLARQLPGVTDSFISDGESGLLFSDADAYHDSLRRLVDDIALRQRIGKAARAASSRYELAGMAPRYSAIYRDEVKSAAKNGAPERERKLPQTVGDRVGP